jgi:protein TonB
MREHDMSEKTTGAAEAERPADEKITLVFEDSQGLRELQKALAKTPEIRGKVKRIEAQGKGKGVIPAVAGAIPPGVKTYQTATEAHGDEPTLRQRLLSYTAAPLGLTAATAIFLFIGWLQPSLGGGERIELPSIIQFRVAKAEPPPPAPSDEPPPQEPKRKRRTPPKTAPKRQVARTKAPPRPQFATNPTLSMMPGAGAIPVDIDFSPDDVAIDEMVRDPEIKKYQQRMRNRDAYRSASRSGGFAGSSGPDISRFTRARLIHKVDPKYPLEARKKETEGEVVAQILIDMVGRVVEVEIVSAEPEGVFEEVAEDALRRWTYSPAKDDEGNPVEGWESVRLVFKMENA